jgi:hypothetical protein
MKTQLRICSISHSQRKLLYNTVNWKWFCNLYKQTIIQIHENTFGELRNALVKRHTSTLLVHM